MIIVLTIIHMEGLTYTQISFSNNIFIYYSEILYLLSANFYINMPNCYSHCHAISTRWLMIWTLQVAQKFPHYSLFHSWKNTLC